jgi:hypothetical protein
MSTIAAESFAIALVTLPGDRYSQLRLDRDGRTYDFVRVFSDKQSDLARQYLQQLSQAAAARSATDLYILVREAKCYSLWKQQQTSMSIDANEPLPQADLLTLQQASLCLFQELWVQWEDLLGTQQLQIFARALSIAIPQLAERADIDRLLNLDPLAAQALDGWTAADWLALDRQLYRLTQKKMGDRFGSNTIAEIIDSLPAHLAPILTDLGNISA